MQLFFDVQGIEIERNNIPVLLLSEYIIESLRVSCGVCKNFLVIIMAVSYSISPILLRIYKFGTS